MIVIPLNGNVRNRNRQAQRPALVSNFISTLSQQKPTGSFQLEQLFELVRISVKRFQGLNIEELILLASSQRDPEYKKVIDMVTTGNDIDQIGRQYIAIPLKFAVIYLLDCIAQNTPRTPEIEHFLEKAEGTVITFNWDVLPDKVLKEDYGVDWLNIKSGKVNGKKYLKFHGSADCLYCLNCKEPFRVDVAALVAKWAESNNSCPYCGGIESHRKKPVLTLLNHS